MAFIPRQFGDFTKCVWGFADVSWNKSADEPKAFKQEVKIIDQRTTADGLLVVTDIAADLPGGKTFSGNVFGTKAIKDIGRVGVSLTTDDVKDCAVSLDRSFASGPVGSLTVSAKTLLAKGSYKAENVAGNASLLACFDDRSATGTLALSGGFEGFAVGAQGDFNVQPEFKLTQVDAGVHYQKGQFQVAANSRNDLSKLQRVDISSLGGLYNYDKQTKFGGLLLFRMSGNEAFPQDKRWLYATAQRVVDESTTVKAKAELLHNRDLTLSVTHTLKSPKLRLAFSSVFDPVQNMANKGFKFTASLGEF